MDRQVEEDLHKRLEEDFRTMEDPYKVLDHQVDAHIETTDETMVRRFLMPFLLFGAILLFALLVVLGR